MTGLVVLLGSFGRRNEIELKSRAARGVIQDFALAVTERLR